MNTTHPGDHTDSHTDSRASDGVTYEIAVYRVHDGDAFAARHHELHDTVRTFAGVRSATALRGQEQPDVFADVVQWASHSDATAAAEQFATSPAAEWFGSQCAEMLFFGHLAANPLVPATGAGTGAVTVDPAGVRSA
jgi:hypothetical protein